MSPSLPLPERPNPARVTTCPTSSLPRKMPCVGITLGAAAVKLISAMSLPTRKSPSQLGWMVN